MAGINVIFRTDASLDIGTGHVMRCLTLAIALREQGANCSFICREHAGNLLDVINQHGFEAQVLPMQDVVLVKSAQQRVQRENILAHAAWLGASWQEDAEETKDAIGEVVVDWLVVDHYALDADWEVTLRTHCRKLMVIDDLADRAHDCHLLLDQNLGRTERHYAGLVSGHCKVLVGPQYALLRPEFSRLRQSSLDRRTTQQLRHLLITMGGVDKDNATGQVLAVLPNCRLPSDCRITVVMGARAPWLQQVREMATEMPWPTEVLVNVDNMAELMADSDMAIGAAGSTSWERCCLGLPSLLVVLAENQRDGANALAKAGAVVLLGNVEGIALNLAREVKCILGEVRLLTMKSACAAVTSGKGVNFVASYIFGKLAS